MPENEEHCGFVERALLLINAQETPWKKLIAKDKILEISLNLIDDLLYIAKAKGKSCSATERKVLHAINNRNHYRRRSKKTVRNHDRRL